MKRKPQAIIYTILADDKPVAALEASGTEARELLKERWFLQELSALKVDGEPIYMPAGSLPNIPGLEHKRAVMRFVCQY